VTIKCTCGYNGETVYSVLYQGTICPKCNFIVTPNLVVENMENNNLTPTNNKEEAS